MTAPAQNCTRCRNPIDIEDLFCDYCGHEIEARDDAPARRDAGLDRSFSYSLHCQQCGATVRYG